MTKEKVLERLQKLLAHAASAEEIGNQAEAEAFAAKAQELLVKHKLDMSQVRMRSDEEADEIAMAHFPDLGNRSGRKRVGWEQSLASAVAYGNGCKIAIGYGSTVHIVGKEIDRKLALYVYEVLYRAAIRLANRAYGRARKNGEDTRGFYVSFLTGFSIGIKRRYAEEEKRYAAQVETKNALMVLNDARKETQDWLDNRCNSRTRIGSKIRNAQGYDSGRKAADSVNIRTTGLEPGNSGPKRLR